MSTAGVWGGAGAGQGPTSFPSSFSAEIFPSEVREFYLLRACLSAAAIKEIADVTEAPGRQAKALRSEKIPFRLAMEKGRGWAQRWAHVWATP